MASALSADPKERAQLSSFRTIGATIAGSVIGIVLPLIVYYQDEAGNQILSGPKTTLAAGIFFCRSSYLLPACYFMSTERVKVEQKQRSLTSRNWSKVW